LSGIELIASLEVLLYQNSQMQSIQIRKEILPTENVLESPGMLFLVHGIMTSCAYVKVAE